MRWWVLVLSLLAGSALAADGVLEISQTCAENTGCFAGDTPGFPVTIDGSAGSSYRLTSDLLVPDENTTAIFVSAIAATVDLGGFSIIGPVSCAGYGATLSCGPAGSGNGVRFDLALGCLSGVVRNGTIRGMGSQGVSASARDVRVENVMALYNAGDGIGGSYGTHVVGSHANRNGAEGFDLDQGSILESSTAVGNGSHGVEFDGDSGIVRGVVSRSNGGDGINVRKLSLVTGSTSRENAGAGFSLDSNSQYRANRSSGTNGSPDRCGGGECTERRRYYVTHAEYATTSALGACATGFHMASRGEVYGLATLEYDNVLGLNFLEDMGEGPAMIAGWIRTGNGNSFAAQQPGAANCNNWGSIDSGHYGTLSYALVADVTPTAGFVDEFSWRVGTSTCDQTERVWCVEDLERPVSAGP